MVDRCIEVHFWWDHWIFFRQEKLYVKHASFVGWVWWADQLDLDCLSGFKQKLTMKWRKFLGLGLMNIPAGVEWRIFLVSFGCYQENETINLCYSWRNGHWGDASFKIIFIIIQIWKIFKSNKIKPKLKY